MSAPPEHHAFLQAITRSGCEERFFLDRRANSIQVRGVDAPYVVARRGALDTARGGAGWLLKNAARLVYASPALLIVKPALKLVDERTSDAVIAAFVAVVVAFFAALNLYIAVSIAWWLFGRASPRLTLKLPFDEAGREALPLLSAPDAAAGVDLGSAPVPIGHVARARGAIVRLGPNREGDATVLHDLWAPASPGFRLTQAVDFAVIAEGRLPAVVRLTGAPTVIAPPTRVDLHEYIAQTSASVVGLFKEAESDPRDAPPGECSLLTLREGDQVEVTGVVTGHIDNVDGFDLEGSYASVPLPAAPGDESSPYRDRPGGAGLLLSAPPGSPPILIRRLAAHG